jgi:hypothetical protein
MGMKIECIDYTTRAHELYGDYGAQAKANSIFEYDITANTSLESVVGNRC